jgi:hypothetical protein
MNQKKSKILALKNYQIIKFCLALTKDIAFPFEMWMWNGYLDRHRHLACATNVYISNGNTIAVLNHL